MSTRSRRLLLAALVLPLVAVAAVAAVVLADTRDGRLPVAQGVVGGTLHPVAGDFEPDDTVLADCDSEAACLEQGFGNLAFEKGPRRALALFDELVASNAFARRNCHRIAHIVGSAALARAKGDVSEAFAAGTPACASGYYHGILDRAFAGMTTESRLMRAARSLCDSSGARRFSFVDYQCRHGLGHGVMIQTGYDLPRSLAVCDRLDTSWDSLACASGAFMENVDTRFGFRSPWLADEDPAYPCSEIAVAYRASCYVRTATRAAHLNGGDFTATGRACADLGPRWALYCFRGLGRDAVGAARYGSPARTILTRCDSAPGAAGRSECLYGAARAVADLHGSQGPASAAELCRLAPTGPRVRCFAGAGVVVGLLYPTERAREAACRRIAGSADELRSCARSAASATDPRARLVWS